MLELYLLSDPEQAEFGRLKGDYFGGQGNPAAGQPSQHGVGLS